MYHISVVCVLSLAVLAAGYKTGPPIGMAGNDALCKDMIPTGHGAEKQATDAPYTYVLSAPCFKAGSSIKVAIKSNTGKDFEGFFTQVQEKDVTDANFGTFATTGSLYAKTQKCFDIVDSVITHNAAEHVLTNVFTWTAPATLTDEQKTKTYRFRSTMVMNKATFWVDVFSVDLKYDEACVVDGAFTETAAKNTAGGSHESEEEGDDTNQALRVLPGLLMALAACIVARIFN